MSKRNLLKDGVIRLWLLGKNKGVAFSYIRIVGYLQEKAFEYRRKIVELKECPFCGRKFTSRRGVIYHLTRGLRRNSCREKFDYLISSLVYEVSNGE